MNIHCICIIKDEVDIVAHTLMAASDWATNIFVYDNGSTDGTWEKVQEVAHHVPTVRAMGRIEEPFRDEMRGELAHAVLHHAHSDDWWCKLDGDEVYAENPIDFLTSVGRNYFTVHCLCVNYYFTDLDLAEYEADPDRYVASWHPSQKKHYLADWSEVKFVRHLPGVPWTTQWPEGISDLRPYPRRISMQHYQYRTPPQMQKRIHTRRAAAVEWQWGIEKADVWIPFGLCEDDLVYPSVADPDDLWRTRVVKASSLRLDDGSGAFVMSSKGVPDLWTTSDVVRAALRRSVKRVLRAARLYPSADQAASKTTYLQRLWRSLRSFSQSGRRKRNELLSE